MGNSDDEDYAEYGTALDPIEEDDVARKKPITVSEQIAVDEKGRRRFHGAFTGGFSAGYFNTVGSKEGWTPSTFKSSRSNRNNLANQNALDFMDDEDKGAFGIAPQILRPTDDFTDKSQQSKSRKRPWAKQNDGPIPGLPVLDQIIQPVKETVGIRILVKMGWRPGKGVGPKIQRKKARHRHRSPDTSEVDIDKPAVLSEEMDSTPTTVEGKVYGCSIPAEFLNRGKGSEDESSDEEFDANELLAPDDVSALLCNPKENVFGLGYKGLDRNTLTPATGHVDLFGTKLKFRVDNKKMSISGEAFGVGAFEENDDDIYSREDMSQYDFALETPEERKLRKAKEEQEKRKSKSKENCIEGFRISKNSTNRRKTYPPPTLPSNFKPYHSTKKSRFDPKDSVASEEQDYTAKGLGRHSLKISERQVLIEDDINSISSARKERESTNEESVSIKPASEAEAVKSDATPKPSTSEDIQRRIERLKKFTQVLQAYSEKKPEESTEKAAFKPFMKNPEKQERYDKYLTLVQAGFAECLRDLQPPEMTEWERDREKVEFERASKLYKPMNSVLSNRFVSAKSHDISHLAPEREAVKEKDPKEDPKVAARMNMFGKLTHRVLEWHPDKLVCKRFNIPNPFPDSQFVGVKGDPSHFGRSAKTSTNDPNSDPSMINTPLLPPPPKKSLFDNLDFSKPPPGLLPPGVDKMEESSHPMETDEDSANGRPTPVLEFQKQLTNEPSSGNQNQDTEDQENVSITRPPIDLFKEIFADSSEDEEEEEVEAVEKARDPGVGVLQENVNANKKVSQDNTERKSSSSQSGSYDPDSKSKQRGVFDKIDLDKLQPPGNDDKDKNQRNSDDEVEDLYGPLPPASASSSAKSSMSQPKFKSAASTSTGTHLFVSRSRKPDEVTSGPHEEVVWVEKKAIQGDHDKSKKSSKKSKKKSSKKDKKKSHKKEKKHKKKSRKHSKSGSGKYSESESSDSDDSDTASDSSITLNESLNVKALQQKLKQMTKR